MTSRPSGDTNRRCKRFVDAETQRALAARMILHSLCFMLVGGLLAAVGQYLSNPMMDRGELTKFITTSVSCYGLAFVVLVPALMLDSLRLSNRIVGPICRLRSTIKTLARGEQTAPLKFRSEDYWQDIPAEFNAMVDTLREKQRQETDDTEFAACQT